MPVLSTQDRLVQPHLPSHINMRGGVRDKNRQTVHATAQNASTSHLPHQSRARPNPSFNTKWAPASKSRPCEPYCIIQSRDRKELVSADMILSAAILYNGNPGTMGYYTT